MTTAREHVGAGLLARVVLGIAGTEPSIAAARAVAPLVGAAGGEVIAVFVRHLPVLAEPSAGEAIAIVEETIDEMAEQARRDAEELFRGSGVSYEFVVREGDPGLGILAVAHEREATMVAIGATIHGPVAALLVASVADHLVHHCDLPLLIIRPDRAPA